MLYTPTEEHFGIVPIESMGRGVPVVAINNGGPRETVLDEVTGFLCENLELEWALKMKALVNGYFK